MTSKRRSPSLMRLLAALAACVLVLGLPRLLVACTNDEDGAHLEWHHAPGDCCAHDHGTRAGGDVGGGAPCAEALETCEHAHFAVELGPVPRADVAPLPPPQLVAVLTPLPAGATARREGRFHAQATGPPRRDAPVRLRSTTLLRS